MGTVEFLAQAQIDAQRERFACMGIFHTAAMRVKNDPMDDGLCLELTRATYALRSVVQNLARVDAMVAEAQAGS